MEEISPEELDAVLQAPQPKARKTKNIERTYRSWFYDVRTELGSCDNPNCSDPRDKSTVMVWEHPSGQRMCRYCWLDGWLIEETV